MNARPPAFFIRALLLPAFCAMIAAGANTARADAAAQFSAPDRAALMSFMRTAYNRDCPPRTVRWRKDCRLPQTPPAYQVGKTLPPATMTFPLPAAITTLIAPAPPAHHYVQTGNDILILSLPDKIVTDAVTLRAALGAENANGTP